ncbi:hypothetical protein ACFE04_002432 [Oxalis oulophora]
MDELRRMQKEQERERRRLRDRQRRQSMTAEERERHLARRRRNYQLRRQRAENAQSLGQTSNQLQTYGSSIVRSNSGQGLDVPQELLARFNGRIRLTDLKRLARSIHDPEAEFMGDNLESLADAGNRDSKCRKIKGVRLSLVKRLARGQNPALKEAFLANQLGKTEDEANTQQGECQPMTDDVKPSLLA